MDIITIALLLLLGIGLSVFGALIGSGGGFLVVPLLLIGYHFEPRMAAGTSLLFVFFNSLFGTIAYGRLKRIDMKAGVTFTLTAIPGSVFGAYTTAYLNSNLFRVIFAGMLIVISSYLLFGRARLTGEAGGHQTGKREGVIEGLSYRANYKLGAFTSIAIGFASSILGIGGGIIQVPTMVLLGFPVHIATATSLFILVITSLFGVVTHSTLGNVDLYIGGVMGVGALIGSPLGVLLSRHVEGTLIKRVLAIGLILTGIRLATQAILGI